MAANNDVIISHQPGQRADGQNNRKRAETGQKKGKSDDIRLAGAPVAIQQRGRARPPNVARTMRSGFHHGGPISKAKKTTRTSLACGKWNTTHLPLMLMLARLAAGLEPLSVPDAAHH